MQGVPFALKFFLACLSTFTSITVNMWKARFKYSACPDTLRMLLDLICHTLKWTSSNMCLLFFIIFLILNILVIIIITTVLVVLWRNNTLITGEPLLDLCLCERFSWYCLCVHKWALVAVNWKLKPFVYSKNRYE